MNWSIPCRKLPSPTHRAHWSTYRRGRHKNHLRQGNSESSNWKGCRESIRPGTGGGGGGGGGYRPGPGGRREYGHQSYSYWEDDAVIVVTHRFHAGHELVIEERLRMVDGTQVAYSHKITEADGSTDRRSVTFSVESK
jgi:hypothetical protein